MVFGCPNTSDIFIAHPRLKPEGGNKEGTVYVELKLAKSRGGADALPGELQRSLGQALIASLRHAYVVCLLVHNADRPQKDGDRGDQLR